jgi:hypothetical protein
MTLNEVFRHKPKQNNSRIGLAVFHRFILRQTFETRKGLRLQPSNLSQNLPILKHGADWRTSGRSVELPVLHKLPLRWTSGPGRQLGTQSEGCGHIP